MDERSRCREWADRLQQRVMAAIGQGWSPGLSEEAFNQLALEVFAFQYQGNEPYRYYCERRGATPETVRSWQEIPAVPVQAFKGITLTSFPAEEAEALFLTSGTTQGQERRGRHYIMSLALYEQAVDAGFRRHLLPDVAQGARSPLPALVLFPPPEELPNSSLGHMLAYVVEHLAAPGSGFFLHPGGLDLAGLCRALAEAEASGQPVMLLGTAFSFVHLLDALAERGCRYALPAGSRIMDTGGYKGRSREVPADELRALYAEYLGIPDSHVVNEYGMTELGSQFYDNVLLDHVQTAAEGSTTVRRPRQKLVPPWVRVLLVDPDTLQPVPPGQPGLLRIVDLANVGSVMAIQTEDLGVWVGEGFQVVGRARGAEARGCSLAAEELVAAGRGRLEAE